MSILLIASSEGGGGFNPLDMAAGGNALWTLVIFALAVPLMWKVVMGPVSRALEERDDHATREIRAAEKAKAEAEQDRAEAEVMRGQARNDAVKYLAEARERAESREHAIVEAAKQEAAGLIETAREQIRAEQDKAISAIRDQIVELTMNAAAKVVEHNVGSEDDRRMVSAIVSESEASKN